MVFTVEVPEKIERTVRKKGGLKAIISELPENEKLLAQAKIFNAISVPIRIKILFILWKTRMCVCHIKALTGLPDSKLSYHLLVLKNAGLVNAVKKGNWIIYSLTKSGRKIVQFCRRGAHF